MDQTKTLIPWLAFCLYFGIICFKPADLPSGIILGVLAAFAIISGNLAQSKQTKVIQEALTESKKQLDAQAKDIDAVKTSIASLKMGSGMRTLGNVPSR